MPHTPCTQEPSGNSRESASPLSIALLFNTQAAHRHVMLDEVAETPLLRKAGLCNTQIVVIYTLSA